MALREHCLGKPSAAVDGGTYLPGSSPVPPAKKNGAQAQSLAQSSAQSSAQSLKQSLVQVIVGSPEFFWARFDETAPAFPHLLDLYFARPFFEQRLSALAYDPRSPGYNIEKMARLNHGIYGQWFERTGGTLETAELPRQIVPGVWTTGRIPRISKYEIPYSSTGTSISAEGTYVNDATEGPMMAPNGVIGGNASQGNFVDDVPEEHALVINTPAGLVVITGCAHAGVINTAWAARDRVFEGHRPVVGVIGGLHLFKYPKAILKKIAIDLNLLGLKTLLGSHCTGLESIGFLRSESAALNKADSGAVADIQISSVGSLFKLQTDATHSFQISHIGPNLAAPRDLW